MSARLDDRFVRLRKAGRPGLVAYVTAGDPSLAATADILRAIERGGADVIEVGVPFSDPLADGPVIQRAIERALAAGTTLTRTLDMIRSVRDRVSVPLVLFTYANPVMQYGWERFAQDAAAAGVDGVLMLDVPPEEGGAFHAMLRAHRIAPIFLLSPTSGDARLRQAAAAGEGFLYVISRLGVTGARESVAADVDALVGRIRQYTSLPLAVGFGLSTPAHVALVGKAADAAVVGSAVMGVIERAGAAPNVADRVERFISWLVNGGPAPVENA